MTPETIRRDTFSECRDATADLIRQRAYEGAIATRTTTPRKVGSQFEATVQFIKRDDHV